MVQVMRTKMFKKNSGMLGRWTVRMVELADTHIAFQHIGMSSSKTAKQQGLKMIALSAIVEVSIDVDQKRPGGFTITTSLRTLRLRASSTEDAVRWVEAICHRRKGNKGSGQMTPMKGGGGCGGGGGSVSRAANLQGVKGAIEQSQEWNRWGVEEPVPLTPEEEVCREEMKARIKANPTVAAGFDGMVVAGHRNGTIARFLRARKMDVNASFLMLSNCVTWRAENDVVNVNTVFETPLSPDAIALIRRFLPHSWHGCDNDGHLVWIERTGMLNVAQLSKHLQAYALKEAQGAPVDQDEWMRMVLHYHYMCNEYECQVPN